MHSVIRAATPRKRRISHSRRLIAVDIENMVGGAVLEPSMTIWARTQTDVLSNRRAADHVVVGTSHHGMPHIGWDWVGARFVVQSGPDGADLALLEVLSENIADRFTEVVLCSGDGIFAQAVADLGGAGVKVVVVARQDGLSKRLALAASEVRLITSRWNEGFGFLGDTA